MMENLSKQDFPLNDALQEILQQEAKRAHELRDARQQLHTLQVSLVQLDESCASAGAGVRLQQQLLSVCECEAQQVHGSIVRLDAQIQAVLLENLELRSAIEEQQEKSRRQLQEFGSSRRQMQEHRGGVCERERGGAVHQELRQKQQELRDLRAALEEQKTDLQNPDGRAVRQTQEEVEALQMRVHDGRRRLRERRAEREQEERVQTQLRREIEIQQRRCEAVRKRLRCRLMKAQAGQRQLRSDITRLEQQLRDLRDQLEQHQL